MSEEMRAASGQSSMPAGPLLVAPTPHLSREALSLYRALFAAGAVQRGELEALMARVGVGAVDLDQLFRGGLIRRRADGFVAVPRAQVVDDLLEEQCVLLQRALADVRERQRSIRMVLHAGADLEPAGDQIRTIPAGRSSEGIPDAAEVLGDAKSELMAIHPARRFSPRVLEQSLSRAEVIVSSGVRLRVVHHLSALEQPDLVNYLHSLYEVGAHVRLRDNLPFRLLMVDRRSVVCSMPKDGGEDTFVVEGGRVVSLMERVFEMTWTDARPFKMPLNDGVQPGEVLSARTRAFESLLQRRPVPVMDRRAVGHPESSGGESAAKDERATAQGASIPDSETEEHDTLARRYALLTPQQQLVLRCLAAGETDRMIAHRAGVTPRTVTRRIAEIYQVLKVESRFQAGVVAHRLGLV
jgi:DNA-binding CsgD family transcriptional regulator